MSLSILHNVICLWRSYIYLKKKFGSKIVDYREIGTNVNMEYLTSSGNSNTEALGHQSTSYTHENRLQTIASAWGYDVVDIAGDGNCFFTAVAFQLHQLLNINTDVYERARIHLKSIGINGEQSIPDIARTLRRLVVDEWTGPHIEEYQMFFSDVDIEEEALYFLRDGHFTTSLGDAMPLATANVLQMSLFIIVPQQNIPFLSVFPRYNVEGMSSLWLAYNNEGPGHYDVLIEKKSEEDKAKNNVPNTPQHSDIFDKSNAARVKKSAEKATDVSFCRCGINAKVRQEFRKTHPQRKYKSRCKCIAKFAACSTACKCHGNCGAVDCKKSVHTAKGNRKSQKRGKHQIDTSTNEYCKISLAKNEELNFLEYFVVVAIVNYFISIGLSDNIDQMCKVCNEIVNMILEEESLMYLPVRIHSKKQIVNTIKKIKQKK